MSVELLKSDTYPMIDQINVAGFLENSIVDGPGVRCVLFLQGCPHRCPHCHNPETWANRSDTFRPIMDVAETIVSVSHVNKLTISGGEPLIQVHALLQLLDILHNKFHRNYHIMCYTGFKYEDLVGQLAVRNDLKSLLSQIDLLVDGPFIYSEKSMDLRFRGSKNQRIIEMKNSLMLGEMILSNLN